MGWGARWKYPFYDLVLLSEYLCLPPNSYVEILMSGVMILGGGAPGRCLSCEGGWEPRE